MTPEQAAYEQLIINNRRLVRMENALRSIQYDLGEYGEAWSDAIIVTVKKTIADALAHEPEPEPTLKPKMGEPGWSTATDAPDGAEG